MLFKEDWFIHNDKSSWNKLVKQAMERDFGWTKSAEEYVGLYKDSSRRLNNA